jgi:hypothetical protein
MPKPPRTDDPDQSQRFIEAARELGCDEDEDAFKTRLKRLAETKPAPLKSLPKRERRKGACPSQREARGSQK